MSSRAVANRITQAPLARRWDSPLAAPKLEADGTALVIR